MSVENKLPQLTNLSSQIWVICHDCNSAGKVLYESEQNNASAAWMARQIAKTHSK